MHVACIKVVSNSGKYINNNVKRSGASYVTKRSASSRLSKTKYKEILESIEKLDKDLKILRILVETIQNLIKEKKYMGESVIPPENRPNDILEEIVSKK